MAHITNFGSGAPIKTHSFSARLDLTKRYNVAFHQGWNDVRYGKPFHRDYDSWTPGTQSHYEQGRLAASHMLGKYKMVGASPSTETLMEIIGPRLSETEYFSDLRLIRETRTKLLERMARQREIAAMLAEVGVSLEVEVY